VRDPWGFALFCGFGLCLICVLSYFIVIARREIIHKETDEAQEENHL